MKTNETAIVYRSHYEMIFNMNLPVETKLMMLKSILSTQFNNEVLEVKFDDTNLNYMWQPVIKSYEASMRRRIASQLNGEKGGRPKKSISASQNEPAKETISSNTKVSQIEEKRPLMSIEDTGARTHIETSGEMVGKVPIEEFEETLLKYGNANEAYQDKKVQMWLDDKQYEIATSYIDSFYERT